MWVQMHIKNPMPTREVQASLAAYCGRTRKQVRWRAGPGRAGVRAGPRGQRVLTRAACTWPACPAAHTLPGACLARCKARVQLPLRCAAAAPCDSRACLHALRARVLQVQNWLALWRHRHWAQAAAAAHAAEMGEAWAREMSQWGKGA